MAILSIKFFLFLLCLIFLYSVTPSRWRWGVLLAGSYVFYACANWKYLALILFTTVQTYAAARLLAFYDRRVKTEVKQIADKEEKKRRKRQLARGKKLAVAASLVLNFGILFIFKTAYLWRGAPLILPLGISFYTFQTIGYLIDVYRGWIPPERNLFKYALFSSFFPQIIQGPINRCKELLPQLMKGERINRKNLESGVGLFLWGMFKKLVISDRAAVFVRAVLGSDLSSTPGSMILLSVFMFNLQLYTDFSGGIDMVEGISEIFGIRMARNFNHPFFSRSLQEYWHRWHITLGNWIKDYVFMPIAISKTMARVGKASRKAFGSRIGSVIPGCITSVITFILIGLWHDVTVPYLLYGIWHGVLLAIGTLTEPYCKAWQDRLGVRTNCLSYRWMQRFRTWMLVTGGEYLTLAGSFGILKIMVERTLFHFKYPEIILSFQDYGLDNKEWFVLFAATLLLIVISMKQESGVKIREALARQNWWFTPVMMAGIVMTMLIFGVYGPGYDAAAFIYGGF